MIGDKIHELRTQKRMSQTDLAKAIHASQQAITKWENGKSEPSSSVINSIANYFNVSTDYLLGRTSEKLPDKDLSKNQKLIAYSIDPDTSDEERDAIIEMVQAAKKFRRRI
ncbi:MAG TPA: helix-turn-helix domain-containing protein [Limosilactobacillus coleohominis]|uniref:DNA-binding helix-turn-helix protein n=1 Tax=Limosilactobacillus coleohominis 101-4-CHN TaxID=575594 RepID=C7XUY0_9LACO|nr:helix-turn-helix transcriptional regulator [Limosilactobacillus coleohominis]EEU31091.1 DNA-binding helix-turn-helix protein [Limosilactobacillus coleohominis 101-4-CHN]HJF54439.1 helix-turn-helix domain-containing protein [Limosilactobacillus coleohominis]